MRAFAILLFGVTSVSLAVAACGGGSPAQTTSGDDGGADASITDAAGDTAVSNTCVPRSCAQIGAGCGKQGDGCGKLIDCGTCSGTATCGGGGVASQCGGTMGCVPKTACSPSITCGPDSDGCGGAVACGTCASPQSCGGGGTPSQCGQPPCVPKTTCPVGVTCGVASDGCGGTVACGTCTSPATCGGSGQHSVCGVPLVPDAGPDGGPLCVPATTCPAGVTCGPAGDGCGGVIASCGTCAPPATCGGGGAHGACGGTMGCVPRTTCPNGQTCGIAADGCGGSIACGTCTSPQTCGGGGTPNVCGQSTCVPKTCAQLGIACGPAGDGCGGVIASCGTCTNPQFCGGVTAGQCGGNNGLAADGSVPCTPKTCAQLGYNCGQASNGCGGVTPSCGSCTSPQYCGGGGYDVCGPTNLNSCDAGSSTTLTGYVYDPANNLPVYNALVYVPVGAVQTPQTGVNTTSPTCGCSAPPAYASAFTGIDGKFTLTNPPTGGAVPVVVQLGKWQRVFSQSITSCVTNTLVSHLTLPSTRLQGNIPRFAVDTGGVDSLECVLLKMGIASSEFVNPAIVGGVPTALGRVHFYEGSIVNGGAIIDNNTPLESSLTETATVMDAYDVLLFPCQGGAGSYTAANNYPNTKTNLVTYANSGGRVFATHYHYDLLDGNGSFSGTATWAPGTGSWGNYYGDTPYNANIDTSFGRGNTLAAWLNQASVYGGTLGQIPVGVVRNDFTSVNAPAQRWIYTANDTASGGPAANIPIHYTFDTPFNQSPTCGRVVYSDFHVESQVNATSYTGFTFPTECAPGGMTPQEKLLEFMLFDLTSCVSAPACAPLTCAAFPNTCGAQADGCGGLTANCGTCAAPATCGGGGVPSHCGRPDGGACVARTCAQVGVQCGPAGDGCGGIIGGPSGTCGTCTAPQFCGGGGPGICGGGCTPTTCAAQGIACGPASDGCGGVIASCGTCTGTQTCGGGGAAGVCGAPTCTPQTCPVGVNCGPTGDGCGGLIASCGTCTSPAYCGGGGPGACGFGDASACTPLTCAQQGITCGPTGDGCGGLIASCGTCASPQTCGGGGVPGACGGGACTKQTCVQLRIDCGPAGDGCGGQLDCGTCTSPQTCGGSGVAGVCGQPSCTPKTCAQLGFNCGMQGDGCGNVVACGACNAPQSCGGGGMAGVCGG